jgi:hypothetical protein
MPISFALSWQYRIPWISNRLLLRLSRGFLRRLGFLDYSTFAFDIGGNVIKINDSGWIDLSGPDKEGLPMAVKRPQSNNVTTTRVSVRFPKTLIAELHRIVPAGKRSALIVAGTERMLATIKHREGLQAGAGAWTDENHPDLNTQEDIDRYLAEIRSTWDTRFDDLQRA